MELFLYSNDQMKHYYKSNFLWQQAERNTIASKIAFCRPFCYLYKQMIWLMCLVLIQEHGALQQSTTYMKTLLKLMLLSFTFMTQNKVFLDLVHAKSSIYATIQRFTNHLSMHLGSMLCCIMMDLCCKMNEPLFRTTTKSLFVVKDYYHEATIHQTHQFRTILTIENDLTQQISYQ